MAYTATVIHEGSRELNQQRPGELSTYEDSYAIVWSGAGGRALTDALGASGLPRPKITRGLSIQGATYVCMARQVAPHPDHPNDYTAKVLMAQRVQDDVPFVKVTRQAGVRLVDQYRRFSALPTDGAASFPPAVGDAVTGQAIDIAGNPAVRFRVPTQAITVEVMYDAAYAAFANSGNSVPDYNAENSTYAFKRNTAAILGWAKGKVLFEGADEATVDDIWRVRTYRFLADDWFHLEQRPALDIDGAPWLNTTATWADGTPVKQVGKVYWHQPYPDLAAFTSLLPAAVLAEVVNPTPVVTV